MDGTCPNPPAFPFDLHISFAKPGPDAGERCMSPCPAIDPSPRAALSYGEWMGEEGHAR